MTFESGNYFDSSGEGAASRPRWARHILVAVVTLLFSVSFFLFLKHFYSHPPSDGTVSVVKFVSAIITGIGAISAAAARVVEGRRAAWFSRTALYVAVIALFVTVGSQTVEQRRNAIAAARSGEAAQTQLMKLAQILAEVKTQQAATNATLHSVQRVVTRFDSMDIAFWLQLPLEHPAVAAYDKRTQPYTKAAIENPDGFVGNDDLSISMVMKDGNGAVQRMAMKIAYKSRLFPGENDPALLECIIGLPLEFEFFRRPIPSSKFTPLRPTLASGADLKFTLFPAKEIELEYQHPKHAWYVVRGGMTVDSKTWQSTGQITSVADLLGTQLFVYPGLTVTHPDNPDLNKYLIGFRKTVGLYHLSFQINGERFAIPAWKFTPLVSGDGSPVWVYQFPDTVEGLVEEMR